MASYYDESKTGCCAGSYYYEQPGGFYYGAPNPEQVGDILPKWADHNVVRRDADRLARDIDALNAEIVAKPAGDDFARAWARWVINWDAFKADLDKQSDFYLFWTAGSWGDRVDRFDAELKQWRLEYQKRGGKPITPAKPENPVLPEIKEIVKDTGESVTSGLKWIAVGLIAVGGIYALTKVKK